MYSSAESAEVWICLSSWVPYTMYPCTLQWRHDEHDGDSNHRPHDCLLNRLFKRRSRKTSKFRVTGLCEGKSPETGEFPAQRASNAEKVSIWWRHHDRMDLIATSVIHLLFCGDIYWT